MLALALLLTVGSAPVQLDLIWNVSPSPDRTYAACGGKTTVCVVPGTWLGICRSKQFGVATKTLVTGELSLEKGSAQFSGCPFYQALLSPRVLGGDHARASFAAPGCETTSDGAKVGLAPYGSKTFAYKSNADGTLQLGELPGTVSSCDTLTGVRWSPPVTVTWEGPSMPTGAQWDVDVLGDLNQDGSVELIVYKQSTRSAMDYIAMLGSLHGNTFQRLAMTVTAPKLAQSREEQEVQAVEDARDLCEHFAGEEPSDKQRAADLAARGNESCGAFRVKLTRMRLRYPRNATLLRLEKGASEQAQ